ncbi:hypothetical protein GA0074695_4952 [Micromonospora viridifaciens]|uniref:Uncharacterized protein n=1 Tax=Micromonospora viridifaciens TaxID=1881 RepID=A0A1C4Z0V1_MICVI|nr:hypothetical protein [Micromonospora viridifaciens]SCF26536.1 hypothetical protein GA0074695_4952 [Micromonospora viridifaciens]
MFAVLAAIVFGFALLLDFLGTNLGAPDLFNVHTLMLIGFLLLSLHLAGYGRSRGRWYRRRRPGVG